VLRNRLLDVAGGLLVSESLELALQPLVLFVQAALRVSHPEEGRRGEGKKGGRGKEKKRGRRKVGEGKGRRSGREGGSG
jgi:hypothetical protein